MRISVIGQDGVAATLRGHLAAAGYELTDSRPAFRLTVEPVTGEQSRGQNVVLEGSWGELLQEAHRAIGELAQAPLEWRKSAGSETEIRVASTGQPEDDDAIERGLLRAILRVTGHGEQKKGLGRFFSK